MGTRIVSSGPARWITLVTPLECATIDFFFVQGFPVDVANWFYVLSWWYELGILLLLPVL